MEWMAYALLVDCDDCGMVSLHGTAASTPPGFPDPLLAITPGQLSALPDDQFIALMSAYRTIFAALTPGAPQRPRP